MTTQQVADRLVALCAKNEFLQAQKELYHDDIVRIETDGSKMTGLANTYDREEKFLATIETINSTEYATPLVSGSYFTVTLKMQITFKNVGVRDIDEICVYQVTDGKIVFEQFFRG